MSKKDSFIHPDDDWENRRLCSDGNCIGVISPDGFCKECGRKYIENELAADDFFVDDSDKANDADVRVNTDVPASDDPSEDLDWENRRLCSDENCIGIIGQDGNCKECGKPYI